MVAPFHSRYPQPVLSMTWLRAFRPYGEKQWEQSITSVHASCDGDLCNEPEVNLP